MTDPKKRLMSDKAKGDVAPICRVVGAGAEFTGKNGHMYAPGISAQSVERKEFICRSSESHPVDGLRRTSTTATKPT
jgi:hypothetical protein